MLRDKSFIVKMTLPALTSAGKTATVKMSELGIPKSVHEGLVSVPFGTLSNAALSKVKDSDGDWCLRVTATGSVSANTVCYVYCQAIPEISITVRAD